MAEPSLGMRIKALRGQARREAIAEIVAEYGSSGQSAVAFCESVGIARVTLSRWRQELQGGLVPKPAPAARFVEVRAPSSATAKSIEVTLRSGVVLRVPSGFEAGDLERLLSLLDSAC